MATVATAWPATEQRAPPLRDLHPATIPDPAVMPDQGPAIATATMTAATTRRPILSIACAVPAMC